jgi:hypothetical protein
MATRRNNCGTLILCVGEILQGTSLSIIDHVFPLDSILQPVPGLLDSESNCVWNIVDVVSGSTVGDRQHMACNVAGHKAKVPQSLDSAGKWIIRHAQPTLNVVQGCPDQVANQINFLGPTKAGRRDGWASAAEAASATCMGVALSDAAATSNADDGNGVKPYSNKHGALAIRSFQGMISLESSEHLLCEI